MPYSYVTYPGETSGTKTYSVPFGYISRDHVTVSVSGVITSFTWLNASQVQVTHGGGDVVVRRSTALIFPVVTFNDGSTLPASRLNRTVLQVLYAAQEAADALGATLSGNGALFDALGKRIANLGTPTQPGDAVNKSYVDGSITTAVNAAASAVESANTATAAASTATTAASTATAAAALLGVWRGPWVGPGTVYPAGDRVSNGGSSYYATVAHTSAATFAADLGAGRWGLIAEKGAAGAGAGDVLAANNGSDFVNKPATLANLGGQPADPTLTALAGLNATTGLVVQTGAEVFSKRSLVAGSAIQITNPAGTSGNPTIAVTGVTLAELAPETVVNSTETLNANKVDTALPTAKAVTDYVDARLTTPYFVAITSSGTWNKPTGYSPDAMVEVELWGAGGGGGRGSQGGAGGTGGSYRRIRIRYADLASSVAITIGAPGAGRPTSNGTGGTGGATIFGSYATAPGGPGGSTIDASSGVVPGTNHPASTSIGDLWDGGLGGSGGSSDATAGRNSAYGGAGGGGGGSPGGRAGGTSLQGGAGGNGSDQGTPAGNGQAPGGGGGGAEDTASGDGGRGEVRIWIVS